jgi:hypothetical protein
VWLRNRNRDAVSALTLAVPLTTSPNKEATMAIADIICSPHPPQQNWHRAKCGISGPALTDHGKKGALR